MAMRLTGMNSGLDTESIIQELVAARRTKVDNAKKSQTKLEWKTDVWKDLNSKLKSLQSKYLMKMRFEDAYSKKTTTVSNSSVASVITSDGAMNGTQELEVEQLAKTGYMTGGQIKGGSEELTALSKLSDLKVGDSNFSGSGTLELTVGKEKVDISINESTTISDVLTKLKEAGLNANFDAKQQRIFIGAKESGEANDFSIKAKDGDANGAAALKALGLDTELDEDGNSKPGTGSATKVGGQDAIIKLNGATFQNSNNVFEINGLTITALSEGEKVSISTQTDTSGIYDMIKDFLKEYNTIINQVDKLYNADSAKGYEPLTSDEKESMSESEVEEWEKKIKDSLLRRDSNLSSIGSALKEIMASGIEVNGEKMYLSDFGIETLGYFKSADNEKNAYHIDGDKDDESTSANPDKLRSMITSDPDTTISFFSKLSNALYLKMNDLSTSVEGYRSFGNFYDDKKMKTDYDDYKVKIADLEDKLADYEDKWYAKFSAMETALAKMQSNASAVTSLLGGS